MISDDVHEIFEGHELGCAIQIVLETESNTRISPVKTLSVLLCRREIVLPLELLKIMTNKSFPSMKIHAMAPEPFQQFVSYAVKRSF